LKDASPSAIYLKDYQVPNYLIHQTNLHVDISDDVTVVTSNLQIEKNPTAGDQENTLYLNGHHMELVSVALDGRQLSKNEYLLTDTSLSVNNLPKIFSLTVVTHIKPQENTSLEGLYKSGNKYCTQCEAQGFRRITYYLDRPDVMSEFTTTIVADKNRYPVLLSNGNPVDKGELKDGRHWQTWHDPFKKPCYLFALVAGNLVSVDDVFTTMSGRKVDLKLYVEAKDTGKCEHALVSLKNAMTWDEQVYGREYDLDLFMIVAVDDFNMGAMENKGLNIFNTSCVLADPQITTDAGFQRVEAVVAHEYFHNWSGNRVTCRDWFQLSLKEGFTVFRDSQFSADMGSPTVKRVEDVTLLRTLQFAEDAGPLAHPVQPPSYIEISNFYTLTIYEKGAEVVRMIYNLLGPDLFRQGSDLYFERHDGQAVTIDEFVQAMADISGRDFGLFKRWYTQAGTPVLEVTDNYDEKTLEYQLQFTQSCPATRESKQKLPFHIPVAMGLIGESGELPLDGENAHCVLEVKEAQQTFTFNNITQRPVPSLLRNFSAPVRLRFDYSAQELVRLITRDSDGFCRWNAMQLLAMQVIDQAISHYPQMEMLKLDNNLATVFQTLLNSLEDDRAMIALMLQLPSEAYLSEQASVIDVDAIHYSREWLRKQLAEYLSGDLSRVYTALHSVEDYRPDGQQIANRALKNITLQYLSTLEDDAKAELALQQFKSANNMTDRYAALVALLNGQAHSAKEFAQKCLQDFYHQFEQEPLAIDQWLIAQATATGSDALERVIALTEHPCFSLKNPNKVRSLIGAFCNNNLVNFHRRDGAGYDFLQESIIKLDRMNPQIASRLVTPLTRWRKYDEDRQQLMTDRLKAIAEQKDLSKDVFEVVNKSLD
jgi:aminopeptidase N